MQTPFPTNSNYREYRRPKGPNKQLSTQVEQVYTHMLKQQLSCDFFFEENYHVTIADKTVTVYT